MTNEKKAGSEPQKPVPTAEPATGVYGWYLDEDKEDGRSLRTSMVVALVVHVAFLFATIPTLASKEIEEPAQKLVRLAPTPKFKKPPVTEKKILEPRTTSMPMPSRDPDKIEPWVQDVDVDVEPPFVPIDTLIGELPGPPPGPTGPIRVGGNIKAPVRLHHVLPQYTEIARKTRTQGTVIVEAVIGKDGRVRSTKVLKGLPFGLDDEAVKAVRQWTFEPSTLNGKPVEVIYVLTTHFQLN